VSSELGTRIAVLSPHLDDGVLSLGAGLAAAARSGAEVRIVTVFGNDPDSNAPAASWDQACGFATEGESARLRREEDRLACELLGVTPVWLPFRDEEYVQGEESAAIWTAVTEAARFADTVLIPGFPLYHPDHARLTELVLGNRWPGARWGFYVEQPYASLRLLGRGNRTWTVSGLTGRQGLENALRIALRTSEGRRLQQPVVPDRLRELLSSRIDWFRLRSRPADRWRKDRAARAYRSQIEGFGPLVLSRIALYETGWGGEGYGWAH
jgi:LmbE family N-acetylglucosaminyl deacetylase